MFSLNISRSLKRYSKPAMRRRSPTLSFHCNCNVLLVMFIIFEICMSAALECLYILAFLSVGHRLTVRPICPPPPPPELARDGTDSELPAELAASLAARAGLDSGTSTSERGDSATPSIDFDTDEEEEDDEEEDIYPDDQ